MKDDSAYFEMPDPLLIAPKSPDIFILEKENCTKVWVPLLDHEDTTFAIDSALPGVTKLSFHVEFVIIDINVKSEYLNPLLITNEQQRDHFANYWAWFKELTDNSPYSARYGRRCPYVVVKQMEENINRIVAISHKLMKMKNDCL